MIVKGATTDWASTFPITHGARAPRADFDRLFRGDRFRFEFGIRPADADWFRLAPAPTFELIERQQLLAENPERHAPWMVDADPAMAELLEFFPDPDVGRLKGGGRAAAIELAGRWEPDFVLLRRKDDSGFRMVGGCVCDPSWWSPSEKLGLPLREIHAPVPHLNRELGTRIDTFLNRLPEGETYVRENWGVAAVNDRNLHPERARPRLGPNCDPGVAWLRVEYQAFRALPRTSGIAFLIWLQVYPLGDVLAPVPTAQAFRRMLASMPPEVARYKGLEAVVSEWVAKLERV